MCAATIGPPLTERQTRELHLGGTVRIPRGWEVGKLSLRKQSGRGKWALEITQDRGASLERRIVDVDDVAMTCIVRSTFQASVDNFDTPTTYENWDEWCEKRTKCICGRRIVKYLKKLNKKGRTVRGAIFVSEHAPVLTEGVIGQLATESIQFETPFSPGGSAVPMLGGTKFC